ncbi:MAG: DUF167 domain-containing protein [Treponema sp.]|jgi:uncharacterized protein (TIGR00251 family)|nr:DUF167 domain-containing protein [Treponema sp.]
MADCIHVSGNVVYLTVKVLPGASRSQILGVKDGRLRVKVAAAPEDGKANAELCAFLAKTLGCPKKDVNLRTGEKSRLKTVSLPLRLHEQLEHICC